MSFMSDEILEQPDIVARLAADPAPYRAAVAGAKAAGVRFVLYAARGTSDNAAVYGKYLATIHAGLPAGLAVPSSATVYDTPIDLRECLVVGISQSGETPDVAEYVAHARRAGAHTIAVTNDDDSLLARQADTVLATHAGRERAVAATKTYTSQLAVLALFWAAWCDDDRLLGALRGDLPEAMRAALSLDAEIAEVAQWLRFSERLLVSARGYNFATALEAALKLKETSYIAAMPYSAADLMHGPIAIVEPGYPALLFSISGRTLPAMRQLEHDLLARGAELVVVEDRGETADGGDDVGVGISGVDGASSLDERRQRGGGSAGAAQRVNGARRRGLLVPRITPEPVSPLVAIVPGQLLALHLAEARGFDPDKPRGLNKVTRTL